MVTLPAFRLSIYQKVSHWANEGVNLESSKQVRVSAGSCSVSEEVEVLVYQKSTPTQNRQHILYISFSKRQVDDFMGELTL